MAASTVTSPLVTSVTLGNVFNTGTVLRHASSSRSFVAVGPQQLQVKAMKKLEGKVVTDTNDKSVTVEVTRIAVHQKYKKRVKTTKNYVVHDPGNTAKKGDFVILEKCAPVSKRKQFVVVEIKSGKQERVTGRAIEEAVGLPPLESEVATA